MSTTLQVAQAVVLVVIVVALLGMWWCLWKLGLLAGARRFLLHPGAAPPAPLALRPLDQDEYAALLRHDAAALAARFQLAGDGKDAWCLRCKRTAAFVTVRHPIWEGPLEGGSGKVDARLLAWCARCDGRGPGADGPPIRLPYLDQLPIRLLPELYRRPAFHELAVQVELYVSPAAPAEPADGGARQYPSTESPTA